MSLFFWGVFVGIFLGAASVELGRWSIRREKRRYHAGEDL
jgi:hypothetical protein